MGRAKCEQCIFRAQAGATYRCDYCAITGHTRLAAPPEKCRHFQAGARIERTQENKAAFVEATPRPKVRRGGSRTKYDWGYGRALYDQEKTTWRSAGSWDAIPTRCFDGAGNWACRQMQDPGENLSGRRHLYEKGTAPKRGGILKGPPDRRRAGHFPDCPGQGLCRSQDRSRRESDFQSGPDRAGRSRAFSCPFRYLQRSFRFAAPPFSANPCSGNTLRFW